MPQVCIVNRNTIGWDGENNLCRVIEFKGKSATSLGTTFRRKGKSTLTRLYAEEALWLMRGAKANAYRAREEEARSKKAEDGAEANNRIGGEASGSKTTLRVAEKQMSIREGFVSMLPTSKTPIEFYLVYCHLKDNAFIVRRRFDCAPRLLRSQELMVPKGKSHIALEDIRACAFDLWTPNKAFGRTASLNADPEFLCFVCAFDDMPPYPSDLERLAGACGSIAIKMAAVDLFGTVLLYDISPTPANTRRGA